MPIHATIAALQFLHLQAWEMQLCSHCLTLVRANVYNQDFLGNLAVVLLPLLLLAIIVVWIHQQ